MRDDHADGRRGKNEFMSEPGPGYSAAPDFIARWTVLSSDCMRNGHPYIHQYHQVDVSRA